MGKNLLAWFCGGLIFTIILGLMKTPSAVALQAEPLLPLAGLILGVLSGVKDGLLIPLIAFFFKQSAQSLYFVNAFVFFCGVAVGTGIIFGVWGFPLGGLLHGVGNIGALCLFYKLACWLWKRNQKPT